MTTGEITALVAEFERDEIKAIIGFAFGNFSGGEALADAKAHFAKGCDHLIALRPELIATLTQKFGDRP